MTTAVQAPPGTLLGRYQSIFGRQQDSLLRRYNVERDEEIELLGLATISGVDLLFLGDPGVGKTWAIELLTEQGLTDMTLFTHLLAKDQSVAELLGEKDVMAMKRGETARILDGSMVMANFAYLDEIFKASPPMLNPLLDIFAKRQLKVGGKTLDCRNLISIFMSSNELPDREDLAAFRDRIAITKFVEPVRTPEGRRAVTDIQLDFDVHGIDTTDLEPLTLGEIFQIRAEVKQVVVPPVVRDTMGEIEQKCLEAGHMISQRRKRDIWRIVKSRAWARGSDTVGLDDFLVAQHMDWNHPDHRKSGRNIVVDIASRFTRQALRLREAMETVEQQVHEFKAEADRLDESEKIAKMNEGFKFLGELKRLSSDAKSQIREGRAEGQDVSTTEEVLAEIARAQKWVSAYLSGTDEDDEEI